MKIETEVGSGMNEAKLLLFQIKHTNGHPLKTYPINVTKNINLFLMIPPKIKANSLGKYCNNLATMIIINFNY